MYGVGVDSGYNEADAADAPCWGWAVHCVAADSNDMHVAEVLQGKQQLFVELVDVCGSCLECTSKTTTSRSRGFAAEGRKVVGHS